MLQGRVGPDDQAHVVLIAGQFGRSSMERFEVIKKLGRGSYGAAIAAQNRETGEMVVIKKVDMSEMDESEKHQVREGTCR